VNQRATAPASSLSFTRSRLRRQDTANTSIPLRRGRLATAGVGHCCRRDCSSRMTVHRRTVRLST